MQHAASTLSRSYLITSLCRNHARHITTAEVPKITMPQKMVHKLEKVLHKKKLKELTMFKRGKKGPVLISCKRDEYNHHMGQTYQEFTDKCLASHGWKHYKSKGDYFTINLGRSNPSLLEESTTFQTLGINRVLCDNLKDMKITLPTNIQAMTIPAMLEGKNILCAAETGSGKTLAYLLPIIQRLSQYKVITNFTQKTGRPLGVILAPSRELASQILAVCDQVAPADITIGGAVGGTHANMNQVIDILVATPGILQSLLDKRKCEMSAVQHVVIDEGDTLLDDSFRHLTTSIIQSVQPPIGNITSSIASTQFAIVGATLPRNLPEILDNVIEIDSIETISTENLHRIMPHVPQKFIRLGLSQKPEALLKIVKSNSQRKIPMIVFCNKTKTSNWMSHFLEDQGVEHVTFNSQIENRQEVFKSFVEGDCHVLVSTDIASRGLDTVDCQHVVNYEFPDFMSDYIHRAGRVGRIGSKSGCHVISFVSQPWEVDLLQKIETAARQVNELGNVNANIKKKLRGRHMMSDDQEYL